MYLRKTKGFELWGPNHPSTMGCADEGRPICSCKFHIVSEDRTQMFSFESYKDAAEKFKELTGELPFTIPYDAST